MYTEQDYIHEADESPNWQEGFVMVFRDLDTDLIGFLRLGTYVNQKESQLHFGLALPDGTRFRRHRFDIPFNDPAERSMERVKVGHMEWRWVDNCKVHLTAKEAEAEVDVVLEDFHASQNWRVADPAGEEIAKRIGGFNHPESGGKLTGRVRIGDKVIEITNGLGYRDHSWGPRDAHSILNNRWIAGTMGPAMSFSAMTVQHATGDFMKCAWVCRDGKVEYAQDVNTAAIVLADGLSTIGGWTEIILDSGERIVIETEVIDGIITSTHKMNGGPGSSPAGVEAIAKARWNGHEGFCDFNINVNPLLGEQAVSKLLMANHAEGLSRRDPADTAWAYKARKGE